MQSRKSLREPLRSTEETEKGSFSKEQTLESPTAFAETKKKKKYAAKEPGARQTCFLCPEGQKKKNQEDTLLLGTNFFKIYFIDHTSPSDL